jgi:uncharacterized membrane protein
LLSPFPASMWISILVAFILVSITLFFVGRVSPYERRSNIDPGKEFINMQLEMNFFFQVKNCILIHLQLFNMFQIRQKFVLHRFDAV